MSEIKTNKISPRKGTTQTIGDSGDTISIPCGVTTTNAGTISTAGISGGTINNTTGTISGLQQVINWDTTAKTANFNATVQSGYFVNTTSGAITVTFPASPTAGDVIALKDYANTFDTNNLTIDPNGNNIQGSANNFTISVEGTSAQFIYVDATRGWVLTDASKASDIAENLIVATGGTVTTCGNYKIHTFTGPGTFCVSNAGTGSVDYLVVAGGAGGAGARGGGGGAGGYRESKCSTTSGCWTASPIATCTSLPITATAYPITVGGGGSGGSGNGSNGSNSILSTITSTGGGFGRSLNGPGTDGGPGGSGGGGQFNGSGGSGNTPSVSPPQGNNGGAGDTNPCGSNAGGGGGGAAVAGGASPPPTGAGGNGGNGQPSGITGSSVTRAGGGGGAGEPPVPVGTGGTGGGGDGSHSNGNPGTANTGGGGGAGGNEPTTGGSGGSGIVIIRYKYQ